MRRLLATSAFALAACVRPLPPPAKPTLPPPPVAQVPPGCLGDLGGAWVHADDPTWRYQARDDGGTLVLEARRVFPAAAPDGGPSAAPAEATGASDAGTSPSPAVATSDAGTSAGAAVASAPAAGAEPELPTPPAALISLHRTPQGFRGLAQADVLHPSGRICAATYPVEMAACGDGGLVLRAAAAVSLGDGCQTPTPPRTPAMLEHRLTRAQAGADLSGPTK